MFDPCQAITDAGFYTWPPGIHLEVWLIIKKSHREKEEGPKGPDKP
jgi:hypothetical protein